MPVALQELDVESTARAQRAANALAAGRPRVALNELAPLLAMHADVPEVCLLACAARLRLGDPVGAKRAAERAVELVPERAAAHAALGSAQAACGHLDAAIAAMQKSVQLEPATAASWFNLGVLYVRAVRLADADAALARALELDPNLVPAAVQRADLRKLQGDIEGAAADFRKLLRARPWLGEAWWGLANLKSQALGEADVPRMQAVFRDAHASEADRIATAFALANTLDALGRHAEAFGVLGEAHMASRRAQPWNTPAFQQGLDAVLAAFAKPPAGAPDTALGAGAIFIVGLPRSGSTLVEQILASHSGVRGSGELPDLPAVLAEASAQHEKAYPEWVAGLQPADWQQLGERYLERTARWREGATHLTDKLPGNWMHVGAIRAMLPGAKVIVCRRDPLETCVSCWFQRFTATGQGWAHRLEDLGAYWAGFDKAVWQWTADGSNKVYEHRYEDWQADPEAATRKLLAFCGLPFEQACLDYFQNPRAVASPSAPQVRQPPQLDTARAARYGAALDPLRAALGMVDIMSHH